MDIFTEQTIQTQLRPLNGWIFKNNAIRKDFKFKDFAQALSFIVHVGIIAERYDHHPEIHNVYHNVTLRLTTHDYNGVTEKDIALATEIDKIWSDPPADNSSHGCHANSPVTGVD